MALTNASPLDEVTNTTHDKAPQTANSHYRGRVRSGCLTCRAKKVKCDEQRPICQKCTRLKRACIYKARKNYTAAAPPAVGGVLESPTPQESENATERGSEFSSHLETDVDRVSHEQPFFLDDQAYSDVLPNASQNGSKAAARLQEDSFSPGIAGPRLSNSHRDDLDTSSSEQSTSILDTPSVLSRMTSQDIYLCTTIDLMAVTEMPIHASFSFFLEEVNPPLIAPYDQVNWGRVKSHATELGMHNEAVAAAILAVQALYKAQLNGLPISRATTAYKAARIYLVKILDDETEDFNTTLVVAFLLCLFETLVPDETDSIFGNSEGAFVHQLKMWSLQGYHSHHSLLIPPYLLILHAAALRGGGPGLLSPTIHNLLPLAPPAHPSLPLLSPSTNLSTSIYALLASRLFTFHLSIQRLSTRVAHLSHYHRSRIAPSDQDEVALLMATLSTEMSQLWHTRPATMRFSPSDLRAALAPAIAEPLITLVGICTAAYHAELIDIGRTLSDPPLASPDARAAMRKIRDIVEGDWGAYAADGGRLDAGYLRPLFLYAIESVDRDDAAWAVDRLREIGNKICRSEFFAAFAEGLAEAQMEKARRVTTRWFCYRAFGGAPPFM